MPDPGKSPLLALPGAVQAGWPDEGVPAHYGDPLREQRATEESAGVVDRSNRGVVRITGPDRLSWLHSLTTQALDGLAPGASAQALVLSPNGHVEHAFFGIQAHRIPRQAGQDQDPLRQGHGRPRRCRDPARMSLNKPC